MKEMVSQLYKIIETEKPDIIVTEMTVVTRNAQAQRNLTMILSAIYGYCVEKDIWYHSYRPTEWRSLIDTDRMPKGRKREEYKEWSISIIKEKYGIDANDDVCDAILIGQAYVNKFT